MPTEARMTLERLMSSLDTFRRNTYSQNGEDGVVAELLARWGIERGWFCEFGAWDGKYGSNTFALIRRGWRGVMIEGDPVRFQALKRTANKHSGSIQPIEAFITPEAGPNSLDSLLARSELPIDFDILSIDIDSYDYQVWRSLKSYRPRLVIIEIDSAVPPGARYIHEGGQRLTSFTSMVELGRSKSYTLVCHTGNLFFVADEYLGPLQLDAADIENPDRLFSSERVGESRMAAMVRKLRGLTWQRLLIKLENVMRR